MFVCFFLLFQASIFKFHVCFRVILWIFCPSSKHGVMTTIDFKVLSGRPECSLHLSPSQKVHLCEGSVPGKKDETKEIPSDLGELYHQIPRKNLEIAPTHHQTKKTSIYNQRKTLKKSYLSPLKLYNSIKTNHGAIHKHFFPETTQPHKTQRFSLLLLEGWSSRGLFRMETNGAEWRTTVPFSKALDFKVGKDWKPSNHPFFPWRIVSFGGCECMFTPKNVPPPTKIVFKMLKFNKKNPGPATLFWLLCQKKDVSGFVFGTRCSISGCILLTSAMKSLIVYSSLSRDF